MHSFDSPKNSHFSMQCYGAQDTFGSPFAPQKGFRSKYDQNEFSPPRKLTSKFTLDDPRKMITTRKIIQEPMASVAPQTEQKISLAQRQPQPFSISSWNIDDVSLPQIPFTPTKSRKNYEDIYGCAAPMKPNSTQAKKLVQGNEISKVLFRLPQDFESPVAIKMKDKAMDSQYQDSTAYQTHRQMYSPGVSASKFLFTEESQGNSLRINQDTPMEGVSTLDISKTHTKMENLIQSIESVKIEDCF